jgi:thioredoxin 1
MRAHIYTANLEAPQGHSMSEGTVMPQSARTPIDVTDASFVADVLNSDKPVLVDFWATWCGPCRAMGPVLEQLADEQAEVLKVMKIDVDTNPSTTGLYEVGSIPTMILFANGAPVARLVGARNKFQLLSELEEFL